MTKREAYELWDYASLSRKDVEVYQIANGEHVCIIKGAQYWLWCLQDFLVFCQMQEDRMKRDKAVVTV